MLLIFCALYAWSKVMNNPAFLSPKKTKSIEKLILEPARKNSFYQPYLSVNQYISSIWQNI